MTSPSDRPTVVLDCDGVLTEHNRLNIQRVNSYFGTSYTYEDITDFGYSFLEEEHREFLYRECWHDPSLYDDTHLPIETVQTIQGLRDVARVVVCSSPLVGHIQSKYIFLSRYFGRADIILASDKSLVQGDILVDDAIHNLESWPAHGIVFDRPWNQTWSGPRAYSFEDLGPLVLDYLIDKGYDIL